MATLSDRMPPPTGVVSGPLMPTKYVLKAASVSSGNQLSNSVFDFSPAYTSAQAIFFLPPNSFATAASRTRTLARQMSGPVPSPSMNGMIGWLGTSRVPSARTAIGSAPEGMTGFGLDGLDIAAADYLRRGLTKQGKSSRFRDGAGTRS